MVMPGIKAMGIMLDARLIMLEAMEWTVCTEVRVFRCSRNDLRSAGCSSSSSSQSSSRSFLGRIMNHQIKNVIVAMRATPPTTPPAMAPTFVPPPDEVDEVVAALSETQVMYAHAVQVCGTSEQTLPLSHVGHEGVVDGQARQSRLTSDMPVDCERQVIQSFKTDSYLEGTTTWLTVPLRWCDNECFGKTEKIRDDQRVWTDLLIEWASYRQGWDISSSVSRVVLRGRSRRSGSPRTVCRLVWQTCRTGGLW